MKNLFKILFIFSTVVFLPQANIVAMHKTQDANSNSYKWGIFATATAIACGVGYWAYRNFYKKNSRGHSAYQQKRLDQKFAQSVEKHIHALDENNGANAQSTLATVRETLTQGANPETMVSVPYPRPFKGYDAFAANRGLFRTYSPPLYLAAYRRAADLVQCLVENKADIDKGIGNSTPLRESISSCNGDTAAYVLLRNGANIYESDRKDKHRLSLIWLSSYHKNHPLTIELLQRGARLENDTHSSEINQSIGQAFEMQKENANREYDRHLKEEDEIHRQQLTQYLCVDGNGVPRFPSVIGGIILSYVPENKVN